MLILQIKTLFLKLLLLSVHRQCKESIVVMIKDYGNNSIFLQFDVLWLCSHYFYNYSIYMCRCMHVYYIFFLFSGSLSSFLMVFQRCWLICLCVREQNKHTEYVLVKLLFGEYVTGHCLWEIGQQVCYLNLFSTFYDANW